MELIIANTYEAMSAQAAEDLLRLLQSFAKPLICTASGASPTGMYRELVRLVETNRIDTSNWYFVGLDEWKGMNGSDEGSCRYYVNHELFNPLNIKEQQICFFDGRANDLNEECKRVEDFIKQQGGIDVALLGIGVNGHIGMNEPGTPAAMRSHVAAIHPDTQQIGQKYFKQPRQLDTGITLGLATILEARHLLLLASGTTKAPIIDQMLRAAISEALPATLLKEHNDLRVYLDKEASTLLK